MAEVKDGTQTDVGSGDKGKTSPPKLEDDPKFQAALKSQEALSGLLEDHGYDSLDDLIDDLKSGKETLASLGEEDLQELKDAKDELAKIHAYWASEEEKTKRGEEDSDDKITRLEKELEAFKKGQADEKANKEQIEAGKKVYSDYCTEVKSFVQAQEDIPEEYRNFANLLMGVDLPANEIDITQKGQIRKMCKDTVKTLKDFEEAVLKKHGHAEEKKKDKEPPPMSRSEALSMAPEGVKSLKDARRIAASFLGSRFKE